jgi:phytoene dehydrogenase-like protein
VSEQAESRRKQRRTAYEFDAAVVGSGPNGLAAAIRIAQHGFSTVVFEGNKRIGGACRTEELTLPGFHHDVGSAVHPMTFASPFFSSLPLEKYALSWCHPQIPLVHPISQTQVATLVRSISETGKILGKDASAYRKLFEPLVLQSKTILEEFLQPIIHLPRHPFQMARFGSLALNSIEHLIRSRFSTEPAKALLAGLGAHSCLPFNDPGSAAFALVLGMLAHAVGWPIPRGGAEAITRALSEHFQALGGTIQTNVSITRLGQLPESRVVLFDITPRQLVQILGGLLPLRYRRKLERFKYGPGIFKIDYALDGPIPWIHPECEKAGTIHLGGTYDEIAQAERQVSRGHHAEHPFLLLSQPTVIDSSRAPLNRHIAWVYGHVPNGSSWDMTKSFEKAIARFAPGFQDRVLAIRVSSSVELERINPNLLGGSITGGANNLWQLIARPILSPVPYRTPMKGIYLCSSSTPPGGGVHGMCGFNAANAALKDLERNISR